MARYKFWLLIGGVLVTAAGCGPDGQVVLYQPLPDGNHQEIELTDGQSAHWSHGSVDRLILRWPLPGAVAGRTAFELYLIVPAAEGAFPIGHPIDEEARTVGLFYQLVGRRAGCTLVTHGTVTLNGVKDNRTRREGSVDIVCIDGTRLRGTFTAASLARDVREFEARFAADIDYARKSGLSGGQQRLTGRQHEDERRTAQTP